MNISFVDVELSTFNLNPKQVKKHLTSKTRAIIPVHILGLPANMPDIMAALGIKGLEQLDKRWKRRETIFNTYTEGLANLDGIKTPSNDKPSNRHAMHLYACEVDSKSSGIDRDKLLEHLSSENIGTGIHFHPVHMFTYYREKYNIDVSQLPVASRVGTSVFSLPLTPWLRCITFRCKFNGNACHHGIGQREICAGRIDERASGIGTP